PLTRSAAVRRVPKVNEQCGTSDIFVIVVFIADEDVCQRPDAECLPRRIHLAFFTFSAAIHRSNPQTKHTHGPVFVGTAIVDAKLTTKSKSFAPALSVLFADKP